MPEPHQLCTFRLDEFHFGIDAAEVQEVLSSLPMTQVPLASPFVTGLLTLRSQIVTAVDLRKCLDLPAAADPRTQVNIIVRNGSGELTSFQVDEAGSVVSVNEADFESPPQNLQGIAVKLIKGVYKLKDRLLLLLDTAAIFNLVQSQRMQAEVADE